jgi:hypothetical protein
METGGVRGSVRVWLRLEGLVTFLLALCVYGAGEHPWLAFVALFLVPDVSLAGYLAGPRAGAMIYNVAHSYVGALALAAALLALGAAPTVALIWGAHIGFDRAVGYGLKYPTGFGDTHLGQIGRRRA